ncbi:hypothetical protein JJD66_16025 [Pseudomonas sp. MF6751]|nr:hypothetical protein [Pseudomonas sp. MF6751]
MAEGKDVGAGLPAIAVGQLIYLSTFTALSQASQLPQVDCGALCQKKRATEVAQNALRAHVTRKDLRFFTLVRVFPDKKSKPYKKQHHEANSQHSGENHIIEKHDRPPALALLR